MARRARTIEDLRGSSEHLYYEISMFEATAWVLASGVFGPGPATNAFLESFTVHVRALMQFFYPNHPCSNDVLATDFFDNPDAWLKVRGELPQVLADVNARVGKEIAHLSYARLGVSPEAKGWNVVEIWKTLWGDCESIYRTRTERSSRAILETGIVEGRSLTSLAADGAACEGGAPRLKRNVGPPTTIPISHPSAHGVAH